MDELSPHKKIKINLLKKIQDVDELSPTPAMLQARAREAAAAAAARGGGRGGADGDKHDEANSQNGQVTRFRRGREAKILKSPSTFTICVLYP